MRQQKELFKKMQTGIKGEKEVVVTAALCADAVGSGDMPVFATPQMIALMEGAAAESVKPVLPEGSTTVGTALDIRHVAATKPGAAVRACSKLTEVDGRKLTFRVEAWEGEKLIGEGTHMRVIVDRERFLAK